MKVAQKKMIQILVQNAIAQNLENWLVVNANAFKVEFPIILI